MKLALHLRTLVLATSAACLWATNCFAQPGLPYDLKLLKAQIVDTLDGKDVIAFFSVTAAQAKYFPPVLSMGITYALDNELPQRVDIMHSNGLVRLAIYGSTMAERNPGAFALIKDEVGKLSGQYQILAFYFKNLTTGPLKVLTLTYGLWEKRNQDRRIEQSFQAVLE